MNQCGAAWLLPQTKAPDKLTQQPISRQRLEKNFFPTAITCYTERFHNDTVIPRGDPTNHQCGRRLNLSSRLRRGHQEKEFSQTYVTQRLCGTKVFFFSNLLIPNSHKTRDYCVLQSGSFGTSAFFKNDFSGLLCFTERQLRDVILVQNAPLQIPSVLQYRMALKSSCRP